MPTGPLPDDRFYSNMIPIVGKKFGHLTVLEMAGRKIYPSGQRYAQVLVRCDCGREYVTEARRVRLTVNRCAACGKEMCRENARLQSRRLPSGQTYWDVAKNTGVPINTINQRWLRGWPEEDLGMPVRGPKGKERRPVVRFRERG